MNLSRKEMLRQTPSLCSMDLVVLFFLPNAFVLLTFATDTGASERFSCQSWNSSPSRSPWGGDRAQLKPYCDIFLFLSFLKVVDSHFLSFSLSFSQLLMKIPSINAPGGVTYKYTNWKKRNITVGYSGVSWSENIPGHLAWSQSVKINREWTKGLGLATTAALGSGRHFAVAGGPRVPYLVSVHRVFLLQLALPHGLIFLLIFLQLLSRYLQAAEEKHVTRGGHVGKHFLKCLPIKSLAFSGNMPSSKLGRGWEDLDSGTGVCKPFLYKSRECVL